MWGLDWSHRVPVTCQAVNYKQMPPISISEGISSPAFALHISRVHPLKWCLMGQGARWVASRRPGLSSKEPTAPTAGWHRPPGPGARPEMPCAGQMNGQTDGGPREVRVWAPGHRFHKLGIESSGPRRSMRVEKEAWPRAGLQCS